MIGTLQRRRFNVHVFLTLDSSQSRHYNLPQINELALLKNSRDPPKLKSLQFRPQAECSVSLGHICVFSLLTVIFLCVVVLICIAQYLPELTFSPRLLYNLFGAVASRSGHCPLTPPLFHATLPFIPSIHQSSINPPPATSHSFFLPVSSRRTFVSAQPPRTSPDPPAPTRDPSLGVWPLPHHITSRCDLSVFSSHPSSSSSTSSPTGRNVLVR